MKTVFTDISHVAHLWASQAQEEATNQSRNFYFKGLTIYSYGSHFPIARIYDKDNHIVFLTTRGYSNTTAKHIGVVGYAINHKKIFHVPNVEGDHEKNVIHYLDTIEELINKQKRARKIDYRGELIRNLDELRGYVELFNLKKLLSKDEKKLLLITNVDELFGECDFTQLRQKRVKRETAKQLAEAKKRLRKWAGCKLRYKRGKVYLRVNGDKIETSMHADAPIREAHILYDRIKNGEDIKGFKIGYHTVTSMNGVLKIGCHEIERDEIDRIATSLNW